MALTKLRVLVVEDEPISQIVARKLLEKNHCFVDIAATATESLDLLNRAAFKLFDEKGYDIILMDIGLPDFDGHFLTEVIRKTEEQLKATPIIAVTGYVTDENRQTFLEMGMTDIITKPLTELKLIDILQKYISIQ